MPKKWIDDTVDVDGLNKKTTSRAVLYSDEEDLEVWLPLSQLNDLPEEGQTGTFEMAEWLAIKKGLV